ncbi:MAG: carboxypeptidase regulatory-like domain-containing protein, partial [Deltaproteobacteria bacterium]|nr:carboxypeptidase regulatory-like domain-containing protein [Deltaproteobacteria bacterium]
MMRRFVTILVMGLTIPVFSGTPLLASNEIMLHKIVGLKVTSGKDNNSLEGTWPFRSLVLRDFEEPDRMEVLEKGVVTFDCCGLGGLGSWSATVDEFGSDCIEETAQSGGTYSVSDDGSLTLTITDPEPHGQVRGYISANDNIAIMRIGEYSAADDHIWQELIVAVKGSAKTFSNADLNGTYHFRSFELHHDNGKVCWGTMTFDGQEGVVDGGATCFRSNGTLEDMEGNGFPILTYTVDSDGSVEIPLPIIAPDAKFTGHLSEDGQVLTLSLAYYDAGSQYVYQFLITAVKEDHTKMFTTADMVGTYHFAGLYFGNFETEGRESDVNWGTITFHEGGTFIVDYSSYSGEGNEGSGQHEGVYTVNPDGSFAVTETTSDSGGSWTGHLTSNGEMIVMARGISPNSIMGRVTDEAGKSVEGITVSLYQDDDDPNNGGNDARDLVAQVSTVDQGYYQFNDLDAPRTYRVHINEGQSGECGEFSEADLYNVEVIDGAATHNQNFELDNEFPDYFPLT